MATKNVFDEKLLQKVDLMVELLKGMKETKSPFAEEHGSRIAELEIKMAKIWGLIVMQTPAGQDKIRREAKPLIEKLKEAHR